MPTSRPYKPYCHALTAEAFLSAGTVDPNSNTIEGVLIISKGPCRGHTAVKEGSGMLRNYSPENPDHKDKLRYQIMVDDTMLDQVVQQGNARPTVKAKMNHSSDVATHFGFYKNFRRDGDHVRADLTLYDGLQAAQVVRNIAMHTPTEYGNSIEYNYAYELDSSGKIALARCKKLSSVDIVDDPAATKALLEEIDSEDPQPPQHMPLTAEEITAITAPLQASISALQSNLEAKITAIDTKVNDATAKLGAVEEAAGKAALKSVSTLFPDTVVTRLNELGKQPEVKQSWDDVVTAKLSANPKLTKAEAIRICSMEHEDLYEAHRKANG